MRTTQEFQERIARIDGLVSKLKSAADPALTGTATELVQLLMELHGAGFERILDIVNQDSNGSAIITELAADPLVSSLLLLYDLHPDDFQTRVKRGLDLVRNTLRAQGTRAELVEIRDGVVRLKLIGAPPAGAPHLEVALRNALWETAPDAVEVLVEGVVAAAGFVPLSSLIGANGSPAALAAAMKP